MTQDTKLQQLVINKLTTAQYQAALNAGTIDPNQLYMTTDSQTLRDITVGGSSIVSNNTAALGTMALETASNYSTKAVADTLYAQKSLETTVAGKLDKISTASKVYGTDVNGNQTSYDITSFGNVDDVKVGTTSVVANKIATLGTMAGQPTTNYYTKTEIDGKLSAGMHYKGTVASYSNLPTTGQVIGDLYNVTDTGANYAWNGTTWDKMSENIDLSGVVPNTRTINGKELSSDITLTASDVNALPSSTVIPTTVAELTDSANYVTVDTEQNITGAKTFIGTKKIGFKQSSSNDKLGFTLYNNSNVELGFLEYNPSSSSSSGYKRVLTLGYYGTGSTETYVGFRRSGGNYKYNILTPLGKKVHSGVGLNSTSTDLYFLLGLTDGTTTSVTGDNGVINVKTINNQSILGSGDITIDTEIDNETITKNNDNELQTVAIVNPNTNSGAISPLKIWNGTEYQWNHGEPTVWNYWQTSETAMWTSGGNIPSSDNWRSVTYGDGKFVAVTNNYSNKSAYSTDGINWTASTLPSSAQWRSVTYGDGKFVAVTNNNSNKSAYSTDGINWTASTLPSSAQWWSVTYGDGKFVAMTNNSNKSAYSTDGINWTASTLPISANWSSVAYGDGIFVAIADSSTVSAYSIDGGVTWQSGGNMPNSDHWSSVAYGDGKFVAIAGGGFSANNSAYSIDGGVTWQSSTLPRVGYWTSMCYGNDRFVIISQYTSKNSLYSTDGINWTSLILPSDLIWWSVTYGDEKFVAVARDSNETAIFSVTSDKCYTDTPNPTTTSVVYSAPEITSTKTITSVGSGTITLSDNLVYNSTPSGNKNTYRTLGDAHPDWLCNINNVGVKIGNTTIATAGGTDVVALTNSEIEELWDSLSQVSVSFTKDSSITSYSIDGTSYTSNQTLDLSMGTHTLVCTGQHHIYINNTGTNIASGSNISFTVDETNAIFAGDYNVTITCPVSSPILLSSVNEPN